MKKVLTALGILCLIIVYMTIKNMMTPHLGVQDGVFKPLRDTPNGVSSQSEDPATRVEPLVYSGEIAFAKVQMLQAFGEAGNFKILEDKENYVHAVFITQGMRFRDDVEIYFDGSEHVIHYRSQSRIGYSDLGVNRERYQKIAEVYSSQVNKN